MPSIVACDAHGMVMFDLRGSELRAYKASIEPPDDLQEFWTATLAAAREYAGGPILTPVATPLRLIETFDLTFPGFGGHPIRGWLHRPAGRTEALPCVVEYRGYGGGRGLAHEGARWAMAGYVHVVMDSRGQGSSGLVGDTPDPNAGAPAHAGVMTRGVLDRDEYYYRRLFTDAARA